MKTNDPVREKKAWIRLICAALAAVILLAVSNFGIFKMLGKPGSLMPAQTTELEVVGSGEAEPVSAVAQTGDFVEHEIYLILKNFAEGTRGDQVVERYAVVPVNGKLTAFCFPQRWLESEQAIVDATQDLLDGVSYQIDKYIVVRGTLQPISESVSEQFYSWFGENQEWLTQAGLIPDTDDAGTVLSNDVVYVDQVGRMSMTVVVILSVLAGLCLLYALYELIRILAKGYAPAVAAPVELEPAEIREVDPATGEALTADDEIEVEITETDPESGEDVTDIEVEITEEEPGADAEA